MTSRFQLVAIAISAVLLLSVLELVRRRKLTEEYSFVWIALTFGLLGLSVWREALHRVARWLDVAYPPGVLLGALIIAVFIASLYFSVVVSRHRQQIERLVEDMAILAARQREQEAEHERALSRERGGHAERPGSGPERQRGR